MSDTRSYPYETRLNIYYKPLEIVEEKQLADDCKFQLQAEALHLAARLRLAYRTTPESESRWQTITQRL